MVLGGAPKINIAEKDLSARIPSFPGVYGAICLPNAKKGLSDKPFLVTSEKHFLKIFSPDETIKVGYDNAYYSALTFLQKSNKLWVRRVISKALYGGVILRRSDSSNLNAGISRGLSDPDSYIFHNDELLLIVGANEGTWNNDIAIKVVPYRTRVTFTADASLNTIKFTGQDYVTGSAVRLTSSDTLPAPLETNTIYYTVLSSPATVQLATSLSNAKNQIVIDIVNEGSGTHYIEPAFDKVKEPGAFLIEVFKKFDLVNPVESFVCSRNPDARDGYGNNIYVENVLKGSNFVRCIDNVLIIPNTINPKEQIEPLFLVHGSDGSSVVDSDMVRALQDFVNPDDYPVTIIMDGGWATPAYQHAITLLCEKRKDCVGVLSVPYNDEASFDYLNEIVDYRKNVLNLNSSYVSLFSPHVKISDRYNDRSLYISPDGYAASAISETAANYEMWYPPAGFTRGRVIALDLRRRYASGEMDYLYDNGINPIRFAPGKGIAIWGQKTLQSRPSALDRLNVRLLLIVIQPAIKVALEHFIFELNTVATRAVVSTLIEAYMENIKGRNGVYDYLVVCDATNNSPEDIQNYRLNVDLFLKPVLSIEYIQFQTVITRQGMEFKLAQQAV